MIVLDGPNGKVANSLPYYGSCGGIIVSSNRPDADSIRRALLETWYSRAERLHVKVSVIRDTPWCTNETILSEYDWDFTSERIGHLTPLTSFSNDLDPVQAFWQTLNGKTRNMIRKAENCGVTVCREESSFAYSFLHSTHVDNILALGGTPKDASHLDAIRSRFSTATYIARRENIPVSALFVIKTPSVHEYFTPAIVAEHRSCQSLSKLIWHSIIEAVNEGAQWWNWGGSWLSQDSLQRFKKRWGTVMSRYKYFIKLHSPLDKWKDMGPERIHQEYPFFYVVPFDQMDNT